LRPKEGLRKAIASFRRALELNPDLADAHSGLLFCLSHEISIKPEELFAEHLLFGDRFEAPRRNGWPHHTNDRNPERRLRIGFVSGDLRQHSVSFFVGPVLKHLAVAPSLSLHAYSTHPSDDTTTKQLRGYFEGWRNVVGLPDALLADKIQEDGIDILIDLSGHTLGNRLMTFAHKPAPVQCSWIGYLGTTGLHCIDYYLADRHFLPPGAFDRFFTEKIAYLPTVASFQPSGDALPVNPLPAIVNGHMTFGSFSRIGKLNREVVALWARLLRGLPGSKMLLGAMPNDSTNKCLTDWFAGEGVAADRLMFEAQCGLDDYLKLHHRVDICLDPFPFTGGTTTSHALWMGVPTLTIAGKTAPGRLGAAMLLHLGLGEFVADGPEEFVAGGLHWANDLEALSQVRNTMRERWRDSPVAQPAAIATALRDTLRAMWREWCLSPPPTDTSASFGYSRPL
jgi:protein O-GlcNAc transferase